MNAMNFSIASSNPSMIDFVIELHNLPPLVGLPMNQPTPKSQVQQDSAHAGEDVGSVDVLQLLQDDGAEHGSKRPRY